MITIRYTDLPEGLHAQAERQGRRPAIYLRPGLTAQQRRVGLRRARQSPRVGCGPPPPAAGAVPAPAGSRRHRRDTGTLATQPGPAPSDTASLAAGPSSPAPSASPSPHELCLIIGPLGVCV